MEQVPSGRKKADELAAAFRAMADRIEQNADAGFGGAFVVAPPATGGEITAILILDSHEDPVQFWSTLQTRASTMLSQLQHAVRAAGAFGRG